MENSLKTTCFAALVVRVGEKTTGHVTIGVNKSATPEEVALMQQDLDEVIGAALPFDLEVTGKTVVGINAARHRDAIACRAADPVVGIILNSFYKRHSKRDRNGCALAFSDLAMHITVPSSSCRNEAALQELEPGRRITVTETRFASRNDAADASTAYTDKDWTCLRCQTVNALDARRCTGWLLGIQCPQWRPKALIDKAHKKREGDWRCCGEYQYASRTACRKCNRNKNKKRSILQ